MKIHPTTLEGLVLLEPRVFEDERGFFLETFRQDEYERLGAGADLVQDNHSRSRRGVLRGLHFQAPPGQPKLVRVARGRVFDAVVDIRPGSPTFSRFETFELDDRRHLQLYVPVGFAHGFCALSDWADVVYRVGTYYDHQLERGLAWDDPDIAIPWPVAEPMLSPRDAANQTLRELFPDSKGLQSSAEPFDHIPPDVGQGATQGDGRLPSG